MMVNAAAYTAVDKAEEESELAFQINATAPLELAKIAHEKKFWLIHYSTDYVFNGEKRSPYIESDLTRPTGVYGVSKLQGEKNIIDNHAKYIILRTSWVYGEHGNNFPKTILKVAQERDQLKIVNDQTGAPTHAGLIARTTCEIINRLSNTQDNQLAGVYHLSPQGQRTWYVFANYFDGYATEHGLPLKCSNENISPIASAQYPTKAKRPMYSVLDTTKQVKTFNIKLPEWQEDTRQVIQNYVAGDV